ncbi:hypothetical protein KIPE111705_46920 [Kibdelosporangium persicum]|nr:hypothetical protein [Kibdelosporangium persicum]
MSSLTAALWSAPSFVGMAAGTTAAAALARRIRLGLVIIGALVLAASGLALISGVRVDSGLAVLVTGSTAMAASVGAVVALATDLVVASAPPERAGSASALSETGTELGGALGMAVLGSVDVAVYRAELTDTMPAGLPPETAAAARDTLGAAVATEADLPRQTVTRLAV